MALNSVDTATVWPIFSDTEGAVTVGAVFAFKVLTAIVWSANCRYWMFVRLSIPSRPATLSETIAAPLTWAAVYSDRLPL